MNIGDLVKVISTTDHYGEQKEFIPIGTICQIIGVYEEKSGEKFYEVVPIDSHDTSGYHYFADELEKGELVWRAC